MLFENMDSYNSNFNLAQSVTIKPVTCVINKKYFTQN